MASIPHYVIMTGIHTMSSSPHYVIMAGIPKQQHHLGSMCVAPVVVDADASLCVVELEAPLQQDVSRGDGPWQLEFLHRGCVWMV